MMAMKDLKNSLKNKRGKDISKEEKRRLRQWKADARHRRMQLRQSKVGRAILTIWDSMKSGFGKVLKRGTKSFGPQLDYKKAADVVVSQVMELRRIAGLSGKIDEDSIREEVEANLRRSGGAVSKTMESQIKSKRISQEKAPTLRLRGLNHA